MNKPQWLALAESEIGVKEIAGPRHHPAIVRYWIDAKIDGLSDDETPWCAAFINAMLERAGEIGTRGAAAKSFLRWGRELEFPRPGCVVVLNRPGGPTWQGHVGLYIGENATSYRLLGGNQGDRVSIADFSKVRLVGMRWPATALLPDPHPVLVDGPAGREPTDR